MIDSRLSFDVSEADARAWLGEQAADWLVHYNHYRAKSPFIIETPDRLEYLAAVFAALAVGKPLLIGNPDWGPAEQEQAAKLQPTGSDLLIPTGGSSGALKFVRHTRETLAASVAGYALFYSIDELNSVCVLPVCHIAGLMQALRSWLAGGRLILWDWKRLEAGDFPGVHGSYHLSLVPTQLYRLLASPTACNWLRLFGTVLVGGGGCSPELIARAREAEIPLALSYGMTEAASTVAIIPKEEVAAGNTQWATLLPHLQADIDASSGEILLIGDSLCKGYLLDRKLEEPFRTGDRGELDVQGRLRVQGRIGRFIKCGGELVSLDEVEAAAMATGLVDDAAAVDLLDAEWGNVVALACVLKPGTEMVALAAALRDSLAPWKRPRRIQCVNQLTRTTTGKVDYANLRQLIAEG